VGEIIVFILVGLVVGVLARLLLPGRDPIGIVATIAIGVVGAIIGGYLFSAVFDLNDNGGVAWIGSILMAMLLLFLYRKMTYGRDHRTTV
jgi:uncharacterized membrane protein YeaQ/YmgE (transglycosylase-associated protein family)